MATTRTSTLTGDGRTGTNLYATFADWLASVPSSLVTADTIEVLEVEYKSGGHSLGTGYSFAGKTTDATRYIVVRPATGHGHSGVWDDTKAKFVGTPGANGALLYGDTHTSYIIGLQWYATTSSSAYALMGYGGSGGTSYLLRNIIKGGGFTGGSAKGIYLSSYGRCVAAGNVVYDVAYASNPAAASYEGIAHHAGDAVIYSNTVHNCGACFSSDASTGTIYAKNNLASTVSTQVGFFTITIGHASNGYNASTTASAWGSTGNRVSQTFTFKAAGNYKLSASDTGALGFGTDLSADAQYAFAVDNGGQSITGTWSIGADHLDPSSSLTITAPASGLIVPRSSGVGTVAVTGTYTGSITAVQRRVVLTGTSTVVSGFDWATAVASPSGGTFSFSVPSVPAALQWYDVQVRDSGDNAVTATSNPFAVGALFAAVGQSNAVNMFGGSAYGTTASSYLKAWGNSVGGGAWVTPTWAIINDLGNTLIAALGVPVGIISAAIGGTSINEWVPGQAQYTQAMNLFNATGARLEGMFWLQGEYDWDTVNYASYTTKLGQVFDTGFRSSLGVASLPVVLTGLGATTTSPASTYTDIQRAQKDWALAGTYNRWAPRHDLIANPHHDNVGLQKVANRIARALLHAMGFVTTYRGPRIRKINKQSATVYDVQLTHDMGTDTTPTSPTSSTGWTCTDPGAGNAAITVSSAVRQSASVIRLTLATSPVGAQPDFSYVRGTNADVTTPVRDNSSLTLPLEFEYDKRSRTLATSVTLTLEDGAGAAAAGQTGMKWAFFDQVTPDLFVAPVAKGAAESTNGSGVIVVDITGTDLDAGANGYLIVTNSDGTTTQSPPAKRFAGTVQVA